MKWKEINQLITFVMCSVILIILCTFSALLIGTLGHELMHQHYSMRPILLQVNYDGSGFMESTEFWPHNHGYVYFIEYIIFGCIMFLIMFSFFVIINYKNLLAKEYADKVWEYLKEK